MTQHAEIFWKFMADVRDSRIPYVIIRGFKNLPNTPDTDIDIVVHHEKFSEFSQIAAKHLITRTESPYEDYGFAEYCRMLYSPLFTPAPPDSSLPNACFRVDSYNSFYFYSPYASYQTRWTLPQKFSDHVFLYRRTVNQSFYIPSAEDEIVLLVCRNLLDFRGTWKGKHIDRIRELMRYVTDEMLAESLSLALPEPKSLVKAIRENRFQDLKAIVKL